MPHLHPGGREAEVQRGYRDRNGSGPRRLGRRSARLLMYIAVSRASAKSRHFEFTEGMT